MEFNEYLNAIYLRLWRTSDEPEMVVEIMRKVTQEIQDVERDERAQEDVRMSQETVYMEVGARWLHGNFHPLPVPHKVAMKPLPRTRRCVMLM